MNCLLATACQHGHLDVVRLLVQSYDADVKDFAIHSDEFAVLCGLPLYAAAQASKNTQLVLHSALAGRPMKNRIFRVVFHLSVIKQCITAASRT